MKWSSRLVGDAAVYTFANFAVAGVPFVLLPILTRALTPEAYGTVAMFNVMVAFFAVGAGLNIHGAIMVRFFDRAYDSRVYVTTCLLLLVASTVVLLLAVAVFHTILTDLSTLPLPWLFLAVAVACLQFLVQTVLTVWQAAKSPWRYGALRLAQALLDGVLSVLLVVLLTLSWQGRLAGMALAWTAVALAGILMLVKESRLRRAVNLDYAGDALRFGVPLVPHALGGLLLGMMDRFIVTHYADVASTGIYVVAAQIGLLIGIAADAFNRAFAPWLMEALFTRDHARDIQIVRYTYLYFVVVLALASLGALLAPQIVNLLAGPQYQDAVPIARYMLLGNAFVGMYYMVANYVFFARRTELQSVITICAGCITAFITWIFVIRYGIIGAAWAFFAGQVLMFAGTWWLASRCHPMPWLLTRSHAAGKADA